MSNKKRTKSVKANPRVKYVQLLAKQYMDRAYFSSSSEKPTVAIALGTDLPVSNRYDPTALRYDVSLQISKLYTNYSGKWSTLLILFGMEAGERVVETHNETFQGMCPTELDTAIKKLYVEKASDMAKQGDHVVVTGWGWLTLPGQVPFEQWQATEDMYIDMLETDSMYLIPSKEKLIDIPNDPKQVAAVCSL